MTGLARRHAPVLAFEQVTVQYHGRGMPALRDVSLCAEPGRITAVVGPNGSGKSSLVRSLLRRAPVRVGRVTLDGRDVTSLEAREFAQRVAVVPQREEPVLPLSVREFVLLGRHPRRGAFGVPSDDDRAKVEQALARTGMTEAAEHDTGTLSGGEWQRVRIARALAQDTPAVVLDEPTTFLDIAHEMAVFELVDALAREGRTLLLVSHQLNLVARFADHIVLLHEGQVAAAGNADAVMRGEILERVYDWPLVVTRDPAVGAPALLPLRGRGRVR
ncbi:MAG: ABC transporter ATP-binding protein [Gemmatimonas sp.]|jgi:iron complex transport system ATP-binding protein|uniref:ABC transporter ATP-binding protein n=1 Tax=Gemmatimonas sp. TaxID=1962908 RepID=UPI00391F0CDE|nr:ABC transporter ATP-binding protein [Gemmatimonadota bacterium]